MGAVRLPNNAFQSYAGTSVTSDIIFLQKRERMIDIAPEWVYTRKDSKGLTCNQYFIDNPDMILGETVEGNRLYGGDGTMVVPFENSDLKKQLANAISKITGEYHQEKAVISDINNTNEKYILKPEVLPADPTVKNFTYTEIDGKIFYRENSIMTNIQFKGRKLERVKGMAAISKCVRELLDMQLAGYSDSAIKEKQSELNDIYDSFTKKFGLINSKINKSTFKEDVSLPLLMSLEKIKDGILEQKADIFTKRTIRPPIKVTHVDTAVEALAVSQLIKIGVSPEREQEFIKQHIAELTSDIAEIKAQNGEHFTIKEMEKTKKDMEARLKKLIDRTEKDNVITFEQLGVDKLFIDEADMFKNLGLSTKMRNISGVSANTKVKKTQDLYMKCQYLDELTGGKGIVFATGTPVAPPYQH